MRRVIQLIKELDHRVARRLAAAAQNFLSFAMLIFLISIFFVLVALKVIIDSSAKYCISTEKRNVL